MKFPNIKYKRIILRPKKVRIIIFYFKKSFKRNIITYIVVMR